jgi:flagellar secretion chaperone FliS
MKPQVSAHAKNYLRTRVMTATREQLQMMLFDGAVRFAQQARNALEKKDFETSHNTLTRAQRIVTELITTLDHKQDPELCGKLTALYNYTFKKLVQANLRRDIKPLDEALKILTYQRDTWALLMEQIAKQKAGEMASDIDVPPPSSRMEASISVRG